MKKCVYISVLLVAASTISNAANMVPYAETFESYAAGFEMPGTNGWSAAASSDAVVSSTNASSVANLTAYSEFCGFPGGTTNHTKVLEVAGTVTNSFSMDDQMVWTDMMLQARPLTSVDAGLLGAVHAGLYFNEAKHPLVYHRDVAGGTNRWTEIPETTKLGWVRATIGLDYQSDYFQIKLDGNPLTNALANTSSNGSGSPGGSWFKMPGTPGQMNELVLDGHGAGIDDLVVTSLDPFLPAIASFEHFSGDIYRMAVDFPFGNQMVLPSSYSPIKSTDLTSGLWDGTIMHSTNGVDGWLDTDMSYSATGGSSRVIYLQSTDDTAFFGLEDEL